MSRCIDVNNGNLYLGDRFVLRANLTYQDLLAAGIDFGREFDMKTGWIFRVSGPHTLGGSQVNLSIGFLNDEMKRVNFSLIESKGGDLKGVFEAQNKFLFQELGTPGFQSSDRVVYQYPWGAVESSLDSRGGGGDIVLAWG